MHPTMERHLFQPLFFFLSASSEGPGQVSESAAKWSKIRQMSTLDLMGDEGCIYNLLKAIDPSRLMSSNCGMENYAEQSGLFTFALSRYSLLQ